MITTHRKTRTTTRDLFRRLDAWTLWAWNPQPELRRRRGDQA